MLHRTRRSCGLLSYASPFPMRDFRASALLRHAFITQKEITESPLGAGKDAILNRVARKRPYVVLTLDLLAEPRKKCH